jgi:hypothetical protein
MPKNKVSDPITDQEIVFARLVLSGTTTDRQAAEAAGLHPDSAAYTKSKPRVRAFMLQHRAAVQQQLVQQEADGFRRISLDREQVLDRLWEIANLSPDMTRGSINGQVKAISMIIAMQNFIPDRRAVSAQKKSAPAPAEASPNPGPSQSTFANHVSSPAAPTQPPYVPLFNSVPDLGVASLCQRTPLCTPAELPNPQKGSKNIEFKSAAFRPTWRNQPGGTALMP